MTKEASKEHYADNCSKVGNKFVNKDWIYFQASGKVCVATGLQFMGGTSHLNILEQTGY